MLVRQFLRPVRNLVSRTSNFTPAAASFVPSSSFHFSARNLDDEAPAFVSTGDAPVPDHVKKVAEEILNFNIEEMNLFLTYMQVCIFFSPSLFFFFLKYFFFFA